MGSVSQLCQTRDPPFCPNFGQVRIKRNDEQEEEDEEDEEDEDHLHCPKGITKITAKRKPIPTWERVDNNLASASKHMGFKRTKGQKRDIKGMRSQVGLALT